MKNKIKEKVLKVMRKQTTHHYPIEKTIDLTLIEVKKEVEKVVENDKKWLARSFIDGEEQLPDMLITKMNLKKELLNKIGDKAIDRAAIGNRTDQIDRLARSKFAVAGV